MSEDALTFNRVKEQVTRLDTHIRFEFDLTAHRVSYLAASEAFLFTAYATAAANAMHDTNRILARIIAILPWVGIAGASAVFGAVFAACRVAHKLKADRVLMRPSLTIQGIGIDDVVEGDTWQNYFRWIPPFAIPVIIVVGWVLIGGLASAGATRLAESPPTVIPTDGQLLCGGQVFSIYAFSSDKGADQFLVNVLTDQNKTPDFLLGLDRLDPAVLQAMVTVLTTAQQKGTRVLVSFVPVPDNPPRLTGVYEPSEHFVPVTKENCAAASTPVGAKLPIAVSVK